MASTRRRGLVLCIMLLVASDLMLADAPPATVLGVRDRVVVVTGPNAHDLTVKAADLLVREIKRRCPNAAWTVSGKPRAKAAFQVLLRVSRDRRFAVKDSFAFSSSVEGGTYKSLEISGGNPRALLYAVGELLRKASIYPDKIRIPQLTGITKPYFPIRGFRDAGPMPFFKKGVFHADLFRTYMEDVTLWGANIFVEERNWVGAKGVFDITDSVGLDLGLYFPSNSIGRVGRRINPRTPAGHKALMDQFARFADDYPHLELWSNATVDNGGWFSKETWPWGKTHVELIKEEASILRKKHPQLKVLMQYQLSRHMEEAELAFLQDYVKKGKAKGWLDYFGPPVINYPSFDSHYDFDFLIKNGIRPVYSDLFTHWDKQPFNREGGLKLPYPKELWNRGLLLRTVWSRRGGPALMPRRLQGMIKQLAEWGGHGAAPYNHGSLHDDTSKYYAFRLLWNPEADLNVLSEEFARFYFGPEAAPLVAEAMMLMETNWAKPVPGNDDIRKTCDLMEKAYTLTPKSYRGWNWRLYALRFRALVDRMIQIGADSDPSAFEDAFHKEVMSAEDAEKEPEVALRKAVVFLEKWRGDRIDPMRKEFDSYFPITQDCAKKVEELVKWTPANYSRASAGKLSKLKQTAWVDNYMFMMKKALASKNKDIRLRVLANTVNYQYAGKDGFYNYSNDVSGKARPNMKNAVDNTFDVALATPGLRSKEPWRLSQRLSAGRLVDNRLHDFDQTLSYSGLKRNVTYRFKLTHLGGFQRKFNRTTKIYLNGELFSGPDMINAQPRQFIFDVPRKHTAGGKLTIRMVGPPYQVWKGMTECWLYPHGGGKDYRIPYTSRDLENDVDSDNIQKDGWKL